jgi:hypothetical protein
MGLADERAIVKGAARGVCYSQRPMKCPRKLRVSDANNLSQQGVTAMEGQSSHPAHDSSTDGLSSVESSFAAPEELLAFDQPNEWRSSARHNFARHQRLVVLVDFLAVAAGSAAAALFRFKTQNTGTHLALYFPIIIATWLIILAVRGAYSRQALQGKTRQIGGILAASFFALPTVALISYLLKDQLSRGFLLYSVGFVSALLIFGRIAVMGTSASKSATDPIDMRTLVVGSWLMPEQRGSGEAASPVITVTRPTDEDIESWLADVVSKVRSENIDLVLLSPDHELTPAQLQGLSWALEGSVDLVKVVALGSLGRRAFLRTTSSGTYLHLLDVRLTGPKAVIKRGFDILVSSVGLAILSPLFLMTAVAVRATSKGPAFYIQKRVGQHGELISFPKFRSMRVGADQERADVLGTPDEEMLERYRSDPRITFIGRFIRRTSIDEMPQIWSVLKGDMSIVGPRPVLPEEMALLAESDKRRHIAKPGLTGLWQVSGRKEVSWDDRIQMDISYIEDWSLSGDIALVLRTIGVVITGRGAM